MWPMRLTFSCAVLCTCIGSKFADHESEEFTSLPRVQSISTTFFRCQLSLIASIGSKTGRKWSIPTCERLQDTKVSKRTTSALQAKTISPLGPLVKVHGIYLTTCLSVLFMVVFGEVWWYQQLGCFTWNSMGITYILDWGWSLDLNFSR